MGARLSGLLVFCLTLAWQQPAAGNGWEHGAIPFEALVTALEDYDEGLRARAAESLGFRGDRRAVEPLLRALAAPEPRAQVRSAIVIALGRLGDPRTLPALRACLAEEPREEVRANCARALSGFSGETAALETLLGLLEDGDPLTRAAAVDTLGAFPQPAAVEALARLALDPSGGNLSLRALRSLALIGSPLAAPALLQILETTPSRNARLLAVRGLGRSKAKQAVEPLSALLESSDDPRLQAEAVIALGAIRDGEALPVLLAQLERPEPLPRALALEALIELGDPSAAGPAAALVLELEAELQGRSLAKLAERPAPVLDALTVETKALRAIAELNAAAGLQALLQAARAIEGEPENPLELRLAEAVYERRRLALYGLGYTASLEAVRLLAGPEGLGDEDARLRATAVRSLAVLDFEESTEPLLRSLADPKPGVRHVAADVLGRRGDTAAIPALLRALDDADSEVRARAAHSLGLLGAEQARDALLRLAENDPSERVRAHARLALRLL